MDRLKPMAADPARRVRLLLPAGVIALAAAAGAGLYLTSNVYSLSPAFEREVVTPRTTPAGCGPAAFPVPAGPCPGNTASFAVAVPSATATATVPPRHIVAGVHRIMTKPSPSPSASFRAPSPLPVARATRKAVVWPARTPTPVPVARATRKAVMWPARTPTPLPVAPTTRLVIPRPPATASVRQPVSPGGIAAGQVLALLNEARSAAGLPALTITSGLEDSSSAHNLRMADGCGLSHQCPGEPPIGDRETAAGVHWTAAGENCGDGGPVADAPVAIAQMADRLTQMMVNEAPPDDGHRQNILNSAYSHVGIAVYRDGSGTVWLTQDFSS